MDGGQPGGGGEEDMEHALDGGLAAVVGEVEVGAEQVGGVVVYMVAVEGIRRLAHGSLLCRRVPYQPLKRESLRLFYLSASPPVFGSTDLPPPHPVAHRRECRARGALHPPGRPGAPALGQPTASVARPAPTF